jgi:hypothetical protein
MQDNDNSELPTHKLIPWNKGKLIGAKPPLRQKHVWAIRTKQQLGLPLAAIFSETIRRASLWPRAPPAERRIMRRKMTFCASNPTCMALRVNAIQGLSMDIHVVDVSAYLYL